MSQLSTASAACIGFAAASPAGRRYRSIAARPAPSSNGAAAAARCSEGEQCHAYSRQRRLNTDLLILHVYTVHVTARWQTILDAVGVCVCVCRRRR